MFLDLLYFQEQKLEDKSLEDEWLSFEKMISGEGAESASSSSRYLVHGMVAYPGMSMGPKQNTSGHSDEEGKKSDGKAK